MPTPDTSRPAAPVNPETQPATGEDNTAVSALIWIILGVSFAAVAAIYPINPAVSVAFLVLSALVGLFGLLRKLGWIGDRWESAAETAAIVVSVLSIAALLVVLGWDRFFPPPPPPPVDVRGMVYVDGQPATEGEVRLLGTMFSGNRQLLSESNPGYFQFTGVPGIRDTVLLKTDVDRPADLPPKIKEYSFQPDHSIEIRLVSPPVEETTPPPSGPSRPIEFGDTAKPLPPFLHGAPSPLKDRFVGREQEFAELDAAWAGVVSGEPGESSARTVAKTIGIIAWGGFGKSTLVRQWLWRRFEQNSASSRQGMPGPSARDGNKLDALFWRSFQEGEGADAFALALLGWFAGRPGLQLNDIPTDSAQRLEVLRRAMGNRRYLLVLDGLEVEQERTRGEGLGKLKSSFLRGLLREHSAGRLGRGLVVVTSRLPLTDLAGNDAYHAIELEQRPLQDEEVRLLLKLEGVKQVSETELAELIAVSGRHPLALKTLANVLKAHNGGRATGWQKFDSEVFHVPPGQEAQRQRHLWRILGWTDRLLLEPERRVMNAISHFREPVAAEWLYHLLAPDDAPKVERAEPPPEPDGEERLKALLRQLAGQSGAAPVYQPEQLALPGEPLTGRAIRAALDALVGLQLLRREGNTDRYAVHGLVRAHFRRQSLQSAAWLGSSVPTDDGWLGTSGASPQQGVTKTGGSRLPENGASTQAIPTAGASTPATPATDAAALSPEERAAARSAIHTRLYRLYTSIIQPVWRPDGLDGLRPLYEAVYHGTEAGLHREALYDVYVARIRRGTGHDGNYSWKKLGAFDAELAAIAYFFDRPWDRLSPNLSPSDQAWLLNEAAFSLRALSRLREALAPMRVALEMGIEQENWNSAARRASNLSELELTLGQVAAAVADGARAVEFAGWSGDWDMRMIMRTTHADALHQAGQGEAARVLFVEAERMQAEHQPQYPRLYSLPGFLYADLLLAGAERAAWSRALRSVPGRGESRGEKFFAPTAECDAVTQRAEQTLEWVRPQNWLLDIALDHLTLARAGLYRALLSVGEKSRQDAGAPSGPPGSATFQVALSSAALPSAERAAIETHLVAAVDGLRESGNMDVLPLGLLTRAWYLGVTGDEQAARRDLDEAWRIAEGGDMALFQADILLTRARLFFRAGPEAARRDLDAAGALMEEHGYHRRDGELADARAVIR